MRRSSRVTAAVLLSLALTSTAAAGERSDLPDWVRTGQIPLSFQYGGKPSAELLPTWKQSVQDQGTEGTQHHRTITYRDESTGLELAIQLTTFADFPAVDWVARFTNTGSADTPILENVLPLDGRFAAPGDVVVHCAQGSSTDGSVDASKTTGYDFQPYAKRLAAGKAEHFVSFLPGSWANSSEQWLPFFNVQWSGGGVAWAVGWSGRWKQEVVHEADQKLLLQAGQHTLRTTLHPGESIRTPRMVLLFWQGDDRMIGHNQWRQLLIAHYLPRYEGKLQMPPVAAGPFDATGNGGPRMNEAICLSWIKAAQPLGVEVFWLDACWFQATAWGDHDHWGTWDPHPSRFPNGMKPVSDAAHAAGMKFLVWFMEHTVHPDSDLAKTYPQWVKGSWDFANPEAVRGLTDYMTTRLRQHGIDIYRHDGGLGFTANDAEDRQGITENHSIEGWYAYWDALRHSKPEGVPLDNCAGGGRNIDLETMMRSLPLWRSDACVHPDPKSRPRQETRIQVQTAGLNLYVPLHGTGVWSDEGDPYVFRSQATAGVIFGDDLLSPKFDAARAKANVAELKSLRELWLGDYYPQTEITVDETQWCGWQFHRSDLDKGFVMLFRRPESRYPSLELKLGGLVAEQKYRVTFVDTQKTQTMTGAELAKLRVTIDTLPGSALVVYEKQR